MHKRLLKILLFLFFSLEASAQQKGAVHGSVRDASNAKPVEGATISIEQLNQSSVADTLGKYNFMDLSPDAVPEINVSITSVPLPTIGVVVEF